MLGGRCVRCGEAVGVYEPAVWAIDDGRLVISSPLAVNPRDLLPSVAAHLHLACWTELIGHGHASEPLAAS
jgi:hypothetical protein